MNVTKADLIGDLVRFINTLEKGSKTVAFMTALLISWKDMNEAQISKIINETMVGLNSYKTIREITEHIH